MTVAIPCRFVGLGAALPRHRETNDDLAARLDTSDDWIRGRTGIRARHVATDETTTDLALAAARQALTDARLDTDRVDLVVVATSTPDSPCPSVAARVAAGLAVAAPAIDVNGACTGFVHALAFAASHLGGPVHAADGAARHALVIGADRYRSLTDPADRATAVLFGDGAAAVVVRIEPDTSAEAPGILAVDLGSDPDGLVSLQVPPGDRWLAMDGGDVFRRAVRSLVASGRRVLDRAGLEPGDVDRYVPHQANVRIIEAVADRLGLPSERVEVDLTDRANTSAASIPLALHRAAERLRPGDLVLLGAVGAGMAFGSIAIRWAR